MSVAARTMPLLNPCGNLDCSSTPANPDSASPLFSCQNSGLSELLLSGSSFHNSPLSSRSCLQHIHLRGLQQHHHRQVSRATTVVHYERGENLRSFPLDPINCGRPSNAFVAPRIFSAAIGTAAPRMPISVLKKAGSTLRCARIMLDHSLARAQERDTRNAAVARNP